MGLIERLRITVSDKVLIVIFFVMLQVIFLWSVDISVSALLSGGIVTNGFRVADPMIAYHIGLYGTIISTFCLVIILVNELLPKERK